jgi:RecG-like helicase
MNPAQCHVFDSVLHDIDAHASHLSTAIRPRFVEGRPGHGKTFVLNAVASHVRGNNRIALIVGTSALAATLYEGGRTAHNLFRIPVKEVCALHPNTPNKYLIISTEQ